MRNRVIGVVAALILAAPSVVLAAEKKETPEVDPAGNQPAPQAVPQTYPAQDNAPQQNYPMQQNPTQQDAPPADTYTPTGNQGYSAPSESFTPSQQNDSYRAPQTSMPENYQQPSNYQPEYRQSIPENYQQAPQQNYQAPQQNYQAPEQNFQTPEQNYQAPQQSYGGSPFYNNASSNYNYSFGGPANYTGYSQAPSYSYPQFGPRGAMLHPRVATAQAGLTINVTLETAISTQVAKDGDFIQAKIAQNIPLSGLSYIPQGSIITGQISEATSGRMMNRSGSLGVTFNKLQLPDGQSVPIQAHVLGNIGKYQDKNGEYHGEGWGAKLGGFALRAGLGAGGGAALGTAMGAITGGRLGTGAWAGTAIGGGIGALDDVFLRRGKNVLIQSGTPMQIQLDAPVEVPVNMEQTAYGAS